MNWQHILLEAYCTYSYRKDKKTQYYEILQNEKGDFITDKTGLFKTKKQKPTPNPLHLNKPRPKFCKGTPSCPNQKCWEQDCPFLSLAPPTTEDLETALTAISYRIHKNGKKTKRKNTNLKR